nr:MAG TPA_asm: hypothetical protein [Caudoviricetes sp.]
MGTYWNRRGDHPRPDKPGENGSRSLQRFISHR